MTDDSFEPSMSEDEYLAALDDSGIPDESTFSGGSFESLSPTMPLASGATAELHERIDEAFALIGVLAEKIGGGEGKKKPRFYNWRHNDSPEIRYQLWLELRSFVDWLNTEYFIQESNQAIPGCWYKHSYAVHIITAIWAAWVPAYYSSKSFPTSEAAIWHRDTLFPLLERLEPSLRDCRNSREHYEKTQLPTVTDEGFESFIEGNGPQVQAPESITQKLASGKTI